MTDRMIPVPESLLRQHRDHIDRVGIIPSDTDRALFACLPEPEPEFTDEEALAIAKAIHSTATWSDGAFIRTGRTYLNRLAKSVSEGKWTPPKALCPPPSPADDDLLYDAWAVIANAGGGNWNTQTEEWQAAAHRWRDRWQKHLEAERGATPPPSPALVEVVEAARVVVDVYAIGRHHARLRAAVAAYDEQEG